MLCGITVQDTVANALYSAASAYLLRGLLLLTKSPPADAARRLASLFTAQGGWFRLLLPSF